MNDTLLLSQLLSGELDQASADALRERIANEPELAALWQVMATLPQDLADLDESAPPAHLDSAVLNRTASTAPEASVPTPANRWVAASGWLIATAAAIALLMPSQPPELLQTEGSQLVDGNVVVLAGDVQVRVDGLAKITVEPTDEFVRARSAEGPMDRTHLLSAMAGAAVTVTVMQGTAAIYGSSDAHAQLGPGQEWTTDGVVEAAPNAEPEPYKLQFKLPIPTGDMDTDALRQELDNVRNQLAELEFAHGIAKGQLAAVEGEPQEWPEDLPEALTADRFEDSLLTALGDRPDAEIHTVDCSEFPCFAIIESSDPGENWVRDLETIGKTMEELSGQEGNFGVMNMAGESDHDGDNVRMLGVSYWPGDRDPEAQKRLNYRGQALLQDALYDAMPERGKGEGHGTEDIER